MPSSFITSSDTIGADGAAPAWPAAATINWTIPRNTRFGYGVTDWLGISLGADIYFTIRTAAINDPVPPVLESATPPAGSTLPGGSTSVALRFSKLVGNIMREIPSDVEPLSNYKYYM